MTAAFTPPQKIGFIGLGKMGEPMSRNLHQAGFKLALYDINETVVARLAREYGAEIAATPADVARTCRVVITIVPDGKIVREVALGNDGLASGMAKSSILIDM